MTDLENGPHQDDILDDKPVHPVTLWCVTCNRERPVTRVDLSDPDFSLYSYMLSCGHQTS